MHYTACHYSLLFNALDKANSFLLTHMIFLSWSGTRVVVFGIFDHFALGARPPNSSHMPFLLFYINPAPDFLCRWVGEKLFRQVTSEDKLEKCCWLADDRSSSVPQCSTPWWPCLLNDASHEPKEAKHKAITELTSTPPSQHQHPPLLYKNHCFFLTTPNSKFQPQWHLINWNRIPNKQHRIVSSSKGINSATL